MVKMQTKKQMEKWYADMEEADLRAKYQAWVKKEQERHDKNEKGGGEHGS